MRSFGKRLENHRMCSQHFRQLNISIYQDLIIRMWSIFDAQKVQAAIVEEENTILYAVPTQVNRISNPKQ